MVDGRRERSGNRDSSGPIICTATPQIVGDLIEGKRKVYPGREILRTQLLTIKNYFGTPTVMLFRAEALRGLAFRPSFFDDIELYFEILRKWKYGFVPQVLAFVRADNEGVFTGLRNFDYIPAYRLSPNATLWTRTPRPGRTSACEGSVASPLPPTPRPRGYRRTPPPLLGLPSDRFPTPGRKVQLPKTHPPARGRPLRYGPKSESDSRRAPAAETPYRYKSLKERTNPLFMAKPSALG